MVMLWLFIVLVVIAVAAIIAVFIIDRRSGLGPSTGAPKRSRLSWSRRGSEQVIELPRRLANSASLFQLPAVRKRIRAQRWLHALLAVLLVMSRSVRTVLLVLLVAALTGALWWWGGQWRDGVVAGVGLALLVGAWDSLRDVAASRDPQQDHRTLAHLTRVPAGLWLASWFLVDALATGIVVLALRDLL